MRILRLLKKDLTFGGPGFRIEIWWVVHRTHIPSGFNRFLSVTFIIMVQLY